VKHSQAGWSSLAKLVASLLISVHVLAVVAEPFHFFSHSSQRGTSAAARPIRWMLDPYVEFLYLNHGYFFFAPEPGPSHLFDCQLNFADGDYSTLRYPDKTKQWPRLLYHRHFMLAEFLNQLHVPPVEPDLAKQLDPTVVEDWTNARRRYEDVRDSMQRHLQVRNGADSASILRVRHILPGSDEVLKGDRPLNDPALFLVLPDGDSDLPDARPNLPMGVPFRLPPQASEVLTPLNSEAVEASR
jgi:hypothetical protein